MWMHAAHMPMPRRRPIATHGVQPWAAARLEARASEKPLLEAMAGKPVIMIRKNRDPESAAL